MKRLLGIFVFALALLAVLGAGPACAAEVAAPAATPVVATAPAPAQPGCGQTLDLAAALSAQGQLCPAALPQNPAPELMARPPFLRTCVCSCGQPCTTDADCDGARCGPGITCC